MNTEKGSKTDALPSESASHIPSLLVKTSNKELWAWWMYNFAYEPISVVAFQLFIPLLLLSFARANGHLAGNPSSACTESSADCVLFEFGSFSIFAASFPYYTIALSVLLQAVTFISVGSLADYGPYRKRLLMFATFFGSISTILMLAIQSTRLYILIAILTILINISFGTASVFYNAYLPLLANAYYDGLEPQPLLGPPKKTMAQIHSPTMENSFEDATNALSSSSLNPQPTLPQSKKNKEIKTTEEISNWISTRGFVLGYVSAVLSLIIAAGYIFIRGNSIFSNQVAVAFSGVWWLLLSIWPLWSLKTRPGPSLPPGTNYLVFSWKKVWGTLSRCKSLPVTFWFLLCYFLFSDGYSTLGSVAVLFGRDVLRVPENMLIAAVCIAPIASLLGNYFFFYFQRITKLSSKAMIIILLVILCGIPFYGALGIFTTSFGLHKQWEVFLFAGWYGFAVGAIQSYSRVMFGELIPKGLESEFFSLYAITDKGSSWVGPLFQTIISDALGNQRYGLLFILLLLALPIPILIFLVDMPRGRNDVLEYRCTKANLAPEMNQVA